MVNLACATVEVPPPEVVFKNEESISIKYSSANTAEAFQLAKKHCASVGKSSVQKIAKTLFQRVAIEMRAAKAEIVRLFQSRWVDRYEERAGS